MSYGRFSKCARALPGVALASILLLCSTCFGQAASVLYQEILLPPETIPAGRQDAAALQQVQAYRQTVKANAWTDLEAKGEFTPNAPDSSGKAVGPRPATLWMSGDRQFRLDVQKPAGTSSLRMSGMNEAIRHEDGRTRSADLRNALVGLFAFPRLLKSGFPGPNISLLDQGMITVGGASLHRISMGIPWPNAQSTGQTHPPTVIDLYFDPGSNLLVKSAALVVDSSSGPARYLQVISYGDYQLSGGMTLPYLYSEQLNGQLLWTLQLNSIQLQSGLADSVFSF
jgi:hypothetical protein